MNMYTGTYTCSHVLCTSISIHLAVGTFTLYQTIHLCTCIYDCVYSTGLWVPNIPNINGADIVEVHIILHVHADVNIMYISTCMYMYI